MKFRVKLADHAANKRIHAIHSIADAMYSGGGESSVRMIQSNIVPLQLEDANGPDLIPRLTRTGTYSPGQDVIYHASLSNAGSVPTEGEMRMTLQFPEIVDVISVNNADWSCDEAGRQLQCRQTKSLGRGMSSTVVDIVARLGQSVQAEDSQYVEVSLVASGGGESGQAIVNNRVVDRAVIKKNLSVSGKVWLDMEGKRRLTNDAIMQQGWRAQLLSVSGSGRTAVVNVLKEALTDSNGEYMINDVAPGRRYALRILSPDGQLFGTPQDGENNTRIAQSHSDRRNGWLIFPSFDKNYTEQSLSLRPSGIVFDSATREPVAGAKVTIQSEQKGFDAAQHMLGGSATAVTDARGYYFLTLTPDAPLGTYSYDVLSTGYVDGLSSTLLPQSTPFTPPSDGMPAPATSLLAIPSPNEQHVYYANFNGGGITDRMINNHLAIDPADSAGSESLRLKKEVNRKTAELIDILTYSLSLTHKQNKPLAGFSITDDLPEGFTYIRGSSRLSVNGAAAVAIDDPQLSGRRMVYTTDMALVADAAAMITYRVTVGANARVGTKAINRARAVSGPFMSNDATAAVNIVGGVFTNDAFVAGKVYMACDASTEQGPNSPGVPGVRIYLENGSYAETDIDGKYSLYGLKPITHVLKIDTSTLPVSTRTVPLDHRNLSGDGRFLDVKNGELARGDFALSCSDAGLIDIEMRRSRMEDASELKAALKEDFRPEYTQNEVNGLKTRAAAGNVKGRASVALPTKAEVLAQAGTLHKRDHTGKNVAKELSATPDSEGGKKAADPEAAELSIDTLLKQMDTSLAFVNLHNGKIMSGGQTNVVVKGRSGMTLTLLVNDQEVPLTQVGRRSELQSRNIAAWEYLGVNLQPGENTLTLQEKEQGTVKNVTSVMVIVPGKLAKIILHTPEQPVADPSSSFLVRIELQDKDGITVFGRTPLVLSASLGTWQSVDMNQQRPVMGAKSNDMQVMVIDGKGDFAFTPTEQVGDVILQVNGGSVTTEKTVNLQPKLRPMIATGILEGVISLRNRRIERTDSNNGFERELRGLNASWNDGKSSIGSRAAFFLKGKVKGEYLLTAAFDSDKDARDRLFRDIEPDRYYPIYGDSSVRGFEAQSTSRLYLRVDKGNTYLLYGDLATRSTDNVRRLTQYDRGITGIKHHFQNDTVQGNVFASRDNLTQRVHEIPATGTSFFPNVFGADYIVNSERIEIVTRQRDQNGLITSQPVVLTQFNDYTIDEFGNLQLKIIVPSINPANGNPNYIRITYESDGNGPTFWLYGIDGKIKVLNGLTIGGVAVKDHNPADPRSLYGVTVDVEFNENNRLNAEYGRTETMKKGTGNGARAEFTHESEDVKVNAAVLKTDQGFDNMTSASSSGKTEYRAKASKTIDAKNTLNTEAIYTNSDDTQIDLSQSQQSVKANNNASITGAQIALEHKINDYLLLEVGTRVARGDIRNEGQTEKIDNVTARTKLNVIIPGLPAARVYGELEMDVRDSGKRAFALGGDYQLQDQSRLYVRHELISSLGSMYEFSTNQRTFRTLAGIERPFSRSGKIFSEYRQGGTIDGRDAQAAYGVNNGWEVKPGLMVRANVERTDSRSNNASGIRNSSTALTGAVEYLANARWKGSASSELRHATTENSKLLSGGMAIKINSDWSFLGKAAWYQVQGRGTNAHNNSLRTRLRLGTAYRPVDNNRVNGLAYYERRLEKGRIGMQNNDAGSRTVDMVSVNVNWQPEKRWNVSGRYAGKIVTESSTGQHDQLIGNLLSARITRDIGEKWDVGASTSILLDNHGQKQHALGVEAGYMLDTDLWLSVGYNVVGFFEKEFSSMAQTSQGVFIRLRYRFDENTI